MSDKIVCEHIDDKVEELNEKLDLIMAKLEIKDDDLDDQDIDDKIDLTHEMGEM